MLNHPTSLSAPRLTEKLSADDFLWFAAYTQPRKELAVQSYLTSIGVDCYVPTQQKMVLRMGKKVIERHPVVSSIVFPHIEWKTCSTLIQDPKLKIYFITNRETKIPAPIHEKQMNDFRLLMDHPDMIYNVTQNDTLKPGRRVRITGGPLQGLEGEYKRVAGDRRVVVRLDGLISLTTVFISPALLENIDFPHIV